MSFINFFKNRDNIIKSITITLTILLWVYFYIISKVDIYSIIIIDVNTIINTFFSTNFLVFLLLFPLPSILIFVYSLKDSSSNSIAQFSIGTIIATVFLLVFFNISFLFVLFLFFYILSHILLIVILKQKQKIVNKPSEIINHVASKATMLFSIVFFLMVFLTVLPNQQQNAVDMQAGLVNLFVGDDLSNWIGTSYNLSYACTKQNYANLLSSPQFLKLKQNTDPNSITFIQYLESFHEDILAEKLDKIDGALPDLTTIEFKEDVLKTIREIPLTQYLERYFAFIFAIVIVSIVYVYFVFAFSALGLLFFFLLIKLLYKKDDFKDKPKPLEYQEENKKEEEKIEESEVEEHLSQKDGPRKEF